ncbi:hypothetical protein [Limnothrix sp. PR1529]|nr:hypothetical protein [Limnothrix sp. PR1529]
MHGGIGAGNRSPSVTAGSPQGQGNPDSHYGSIAPKTGQATRSGFEWR